MIECQNKYLLILIYLDDLFFEFNTRLQFPTTLSGNSRRRISVI